jgi:DNA-binding MarR family transcriptional regulator
VGEHQDAAAVRRALHRFGLARDRLNIGVARAAGLSQSDLLALEHLEETGTDGLSPRDLGDALRLTSGAVTGVIDRLERTGWVTRRPHEHDRRSVRVVLSDTARAEGARVVGRYERELDELVARLEPQAQAIVCGFLEAAAATANKHSHTFWRPPAPKRATPARRSPKTP